ncbi:hypothetical protein [Candidatus Villigracilis affinis]|uniref:hypothetical protein n=1 Tax=Candidatus Villigracilis affinis TaxID=3140682 RepID=UPI002A1C2995|nr:hypothetical protein [Anaerolineales bacterium]
MATKNVHPGTSHKIKRIGIILNGFNNVNISALNYLVLQMNSMQHTFEYEFLPSLLDDDFINTLSSTEPIIRQQLKSRTPDFEKRYTLFIQSLISSYSLQEKPADYFIFVTTAKFADNFYTMRTGEYPF